MDTHSRLSSIYRSMKNRCYNVKSINYKWYGGRGISICSEWINKEKASIPNTNIRNTTKGFLAFRTWALSNGYKEDLTLDRINGDKDYSPDNCKWVTMKEQNNHTKHNRMCCYNGQTRPLVQWCEILNLNYSKVNQRLWRGWSVEKAFTTP